MPDPTDMISPPYACSMAARPALLMPSRRTRPLLHAYHTYAPAQRMTAAVLMLDLTGRPWTHDSLLSALCVKDYDKFKKQKGEGSGCIIQSYTCFFAALKVSKYHHISPTHRRQRMFKF